MTPYVNIRDYRLETDTDDSNAIDLAIAAVAAQGGGTVLIPAGITFVSRTHRLPLTASTHIRVMGEGGYSSRIQRVSSFGGTVFEYNGNIADNCTVVIEGLFFLSNWQTDVQVVAPTIYLHGVNPQAIRVQNCLFWDQHIAIHSVSVSNIWITGCRDFHSFEALTAPTKYNGYAGFVFDGALAGVFISDSIILDQAVLSSQQLLYGIYVGGGDGIQITNCGISAQHGVMLEAGSGYNIDDVYLSNVIVDTCSQSSLTIKGNNIGGKAYTNLRFEGCHFDTGPSWDPANAPSNTVLLLGNADCVWFSNCNIGRADQYGLYIAGSYNSWAGTPKQSIVFNGCTIQDCNISNRSGVPGVFINSPGVTFSNGGSGNINNMGQQKYGLVVGADADGAIVIGNRFSKNQIQGILLHGDAAGCLIAHNA